MRLSPPAPSVRARLAAAAPRAWQKGRENALFETLAGLAQDALPGRFDGLEGHPLFAISCPPPSSGVREALADIPLPERLIGLHELYREASSDRRATGVYYTPTWLAELVVARTFAPSTDDVSTPPPATVVDPACGAGAFLVPALRARLASPRSARRSAVAETFVAGTDVDPHAIAIARAALSLVVAEGSRRGAVELAFPALRVADPLHERTTEIADGVLGNPPYLDAKARARQSRTEGAFLRERFPDLHGAFDLFAAFVLRSLELLRPGGRAGFVIPDKILSAGYATALRRRLLTETTLVEIVDLTPRAPFPGAAVFPLFLRFERRVPRPGHAVAFGAIDARGGLSIHAWRPQHALDATSFSWREPPRSRRELVPLESRLDLAAGTAGFDARALLAVLRDGEAEPPDRDSCPFVVTGSIDRYVLRPGPVRFLKRTFRRPFVPGEALAGFAEGRRVLFRSAKLVLAGMGKRLEATFVGTPLALGVATYGATARQGELLAYLAIVNSAWASHVYFERHGERRLSGGYVTFHRRELAALPIPALSEAEESRLAALARSRLDVTDDEERARLDRQIDDEILGIVGLSRPERAAIVGRFALAPRRR